jgi:hypothetical protein
VPKTLRKISRPGCGGCRPHKARTPHEGKFAAAFGAVFTADGVRAVKTPVGPPVADGGRVRQQGKDGEHRLVSSYREEVGT